MSEGEMEPHNVPEDHISAYETHGIPVDGGYFLADLRVIAGRVKVSGRSGMTKAELIAALNGRLTA
jgi:hypothetical protein